METPNVVLSTPLQQLKDEHVLLRTDMNLFYELTEEMELESGPSLHKLFVKLHEQIASFTVKLKEHSKREEEGLFPMMVTYLGESDNTIDVMEYEHEKAEQHLQDFLTEASQVSLNIEDNEAQSLAVYAVQAYTTLTQHFAKEEKVLFPLAETILTVEKKKELERLFKEISE